MSAQSSHHRDNDRVIVVGAGLSGIATALGVALRGRQVTVFESADQVGGAAAYSGGQVWVGANHVAARTVSTTTWPARSITSAASPTCTPSCSTNGRWNGL